MGDDREERCALERMLEQRRLRIVLQPIVDLVARRILAHEVLVRGTPPFATTEALLGAAVRHGLMGRLGRLVRERALEVAPDAPLFVNVHPQELTERHLVQPDDPIFAHPYDVYLEITESAPLAHFELCERVLRDLRKRGVYVVIDDLGAGFSNLRYIADLEPRMVKLDRSLVAGLPESERARRLLAAVATLCESLEADVIAEGIETVAELEAVMAAGVRYGQGFLLARPGVPAPALCWPEELRGATPVVHESGPPPDHRPSHVTMRPPYRGREERRARRPKHGR
jgi:EAL domain-containing protein (putative c-di-GMP-specific phosphodiesterase class I)